MNEVIENKIPLLLSDIKEKEFINGRWHYYNPYEIIRDVLNLCYEDGSPMLIQRREPLSRVGETVYIYPCCSPYRLQSE